MKRVLFLAVLALLVTPAYAYIGPGAGISVLGSLLGIIAGVLVAIFAVIAWPVRRMLKKRKAAQAITEETPQAEIPADAPAAKED